MFRHAIIVTALTVASAGLPAPARAQDGSANAAPSTDSRGVSARWNNGIEITSRGGAGKLQFGTLLQVDGRHTPDDPLHEVTDAFAPRRLRAIVQGRAGKHLAFRVVPDFSSGTMVLFDAYLDVRVSKAFGVRIGKDKTPVGLEQVYSDFAVLFPERSLVTDLVPNRSLGIQAHGDLGGGRLSYIGAVFNGVPDGAKPDVATTGSKDVAGRLTLRPFLHGRRLTALGGVSVAIGGTAGHESGALPSLKSTAQQTFFSYAAAAAADGRRTRVSPSVSYYYKSLGAFAEYAHTTQAVTRADTAGEITNSAWGVTGSLVLTGEPATEHGVVPKRVSNRAHGHSGALQLIARHSHLAVDPLAFAGGFAALNASRTASATGVGVVWYTDAYIKYVLTFERTVFDGSATARRLPEHAIVFRMQVNVHPGL